MKRVKWKNVLILFICIICIICLIISLVNITKWIVDSKKTNSELKDIQEEYDVKEIKDNKNTEIINNDDINKNNPYWKYIKMNLIDVDFSELKKTNNETKGWVQVKGTNINYPFVQTKDNVYYLDHSFDKSTTHAGWVFLDYRNNITNIDKNTIIYGHNRADKTMFGSLKNILTSDWLNNTDNHIVRLSTENENTMWQVFSVYHITTTTDYLTIDFNDNEFNDFTNMLIKRSKYNFNTTVNKDDHILTLSSCYNQTEKVVLHAKLIKRQIKTNQ